MLNDRLFAAASLGELSRSPEIQNGADIIYLYLNSKFISESYYIRTLFLLLTINRSQKSAKRGLSIAFKLSLVAASTLTYNCRISKTMS